MNIGAIKNFGLGFSGKTAKTPARSAEANQGSQGAICPYHSDTVSFTCSKTHLSNKNKGVPQNVINYLGDNVQYLDEAKSILNDAVFEFPIDKNTTFKGTLRDYFEISIINDKGPVPCHRIYHGTLKESKDAILKEGKLNYTKTGRTRCAPGTYFSGGMGSIFSYGSSCLEAEYVGKMKNLPVFRYNFYEEVNENQEIHSLLADKLPNANIDKLLKVCAHDILANDMGIDMLYSCGGRAEGCFVVLNDECMKLLG